MSWPNKHTLKQTQTDTGRLSDPDPYSRSCRIRILNTHPDPGVQKGFISAKKGMKNRHKATVYFLIFHDLRQQFKNVKNLKYVFKHYFFYYSVKNIGTVPLDPGPDPYSL